jgi:hypothetical protein
MKGSDLSSLPSPRLAISVRPSIVALVAVAIPNCHSGTVILKLSDARLDATFIAVRRAARPPGRVLGSVCRRSRCSFGQKCVVKGIQGAVAVCL